MITLMKPETTLYYVRKQVGLSHFSHVPRDFCFLFKGHALDPSVEDSMRAMKIAVHNEVRVPCRLCTPPQWHLMCAPPFHKSALLPLPQDQYMIFIDTTHCQLAPDARTNIILVAVVACTIVALVAFRMGVRYKLKKKRGYEQVSIEDESVERTRLCRVTKMCKKKLIGAQGDDDDAASKSTAMAL